MTLRFWNKRVNHYLVVGFCSAAFVLGLVGGCDLCPSLPFSARSVARNGCKKYEPATFAEKIVAVSCRVGPWRSRGDLLQSEDFRAMYVHPGCYCDHLWTVLDSPWFTQRQKLIAVHAMDRLAPAQRLRVVEKGRALFRTGRLAPAIWHALEGASPAEKEDRSSAPSVGKCVLKDALDGILVAEQKRQKTSHPTWNRNDLFVYPDFVAIATHPDAYWEEALQCIEQKPKTASYYVLLFDAMTQLQAVRYAQLMERFCQAYVAGGWPPDRLHACLIGEGAEHKRWLIDRYDHPEVQRILRKIATHSGFPTRFKVRVADIQSGKEKVRRACTGSAGPPFVFHETIAGKWYSDDTALFVLVFFVLRKLLRFL